MEKKDRMELEDGSIISAIERIDRTFPKYGMTIVVVVIALVFLSAFLISNKLVLTFTP